MCPWFAHVALRRASACLPPARSSQRIPAISSRCNRQRYEDSTGCSVCNACKLDPKIPSLLFRVLHVLLRRTRDYNRVTWSSCAPISNIHCFLWLQQPLWQHHSNLERLRCPAREDARRKKGSSFCRRMKKEKIGKVESRVIKEK